MILSEIVSLLNAKQLTTHASADHNIRSVCSSDMMSDVLANVQKDSILLTGLTNLQVIRTAEMLDLVCVIFVRGKSPSEEIIEKANELHIPVYTSALPMYDACGILYEAGIKGER